MKKHLLPIFLALVLMVNLLPITTLATGSDDGDDYKYEYGVGLPWCGNWDLGCGPGDCVHVTEWIFETDSIQGEKREPTFIEKFNATWATASHTKTADGSTTMGYVNRATGDRKTVTWGSNGLTYEVDMDQNGYVTGFHTTRRDEDGKLQQVLLGHLDSGRPKTTLWDYVSGSMTAMNPWDGGNPAIYVSHTSGLADSSQVYTSIQYGGLYYMDFGLTKHEEVHPSGVTIVRWIGNNEKEYALYVDCSAAVTSETTTENADGSETTLTTYDNGVTKTYIEYADGTYSLVWADKDGIVIYSETTNEQVPLPAPSDGENVSGDGETADSTSQTTLTPEAGKDLVDAAKETGADEVVIAPEIPAGATKVDVNLPGSAVSDMGADTGADLVVSTSVADVRIPNGGLSDLAAQGGDVTISAEKAGNTVMLDIASGGQTVGAVPGGVTLTVPAANATPGTVAVLVKEDGSREVIRKSVATEGQVTIPLEGSAKVEIQDNSKDFSDVPEDRWSAASINFCASRGIIDGSGNGTFDPTGNVTGTSMAMMLLRALGYDQDAEDQSSPWYQGAMEWAKAEGINDGTNPDGSITREQLATMFWRYAGSPGNATPDTLFAQGSTRLEAAQAMQWAKNQDLLTGTITSGPKNYLSREEAADVIFRYLTSAPINQREAPIRDPDIAEEMMAYTKNNILIQSAQAMLAQANQVPQGVLTMLQ